ncbi:DUF6684 family protein [Salarchaeum sp. JOR-1]|uniref:DUF6684 family protein n=1 Tax=Salarchaeum sp. JOR-1 TaxID=2599399 RepID=UPI001198A00D|nr:DUF6684 family protein [Salarchaeum sp. JOR-1]QDX39659.1 hypothetical protein FQU85_01650 [Salarchaeum sp. JOR-1]
MTADLLDKDVLLDLTVNFIPLAIIAFFAVLFVVFNPWASEGLFGMVLQISILAIWFVALAILTYAAAKRIED